MSNYSVSNKFLHKVVLQYPQISEMLFEVECFLSRPKIDEKQQHIFISGLARAGTTILLQELNEIGEFRSLTYRDMPFVMAPNLWKKIKLNSKVDLKGRERSHGDGITINLDSPEAFEEVFWRTFCGKDYLNSADGLHLHEVDAQILNKFRKYVGLILKNSSSGRYLSKNNNNILRLGSILKAFPKAQVIIPFRSPYRHAMSLLNQHNNFLKVSGRNTFNKNYMGWLGHHEFGPKHLPFLFPNFLAKRSDTKNVDYWLDLWDCSYQYLFDNFSKNKNVCFLCFEDLIDDSNVWKALLNWLNVESKYLGKFKSQIIEQEPIKRESSEILYNKMRQIKSIDLNSD